MNGFSIKRAPLFARGLWCHRNGATQTGRTRRETPLGKDPFGVRFCRFRLRKIRSGFAENGHSSGAEQRTSIAMSSHFWCKLGAIFGSTVVLIHNLRLVSCPAGPPDKRGAFLFSRYDRLGSRFAGFRCASLRPFSPKAAIPQRLRKRQFVANSSRCPKRRCGMRVRI